MKRFTVQEQKNIKKSFVSRWEEMKRRCSHRARIRKYETSSYSSKNIRIIWTNLVSFRNDMWLSFVEHVGKFGLGGTQIDRIDNDGDYSRENCRWVTPSENALNRKSTRMIMFRGKLTPITYVSMELFGNRTLLNARLSSGFSLEDAIRKPRRPRGKWER